MKKYLHMYENKGSQASCRNQIKYKKNTSFEKLNAKKQHRTNNKQILYCFFFSSFSVPVNFIKEHTLAQDVSAVGVCCRFMVSK